MYIVQVDVRNIDVLCQIGVQDFQVVVVVVGLFIEVLVLIIVNFVDLKVLQIWVKVVLQLYGKIFVCVGVNYVIYLECEVGECVVYLVSGCMFDFICFDDDFVFVKMYLLKFICGVGLNEFGVWLKYKVIVVGVKSLGKLFCYVEVNMIVINYDFIIVLGINSDIECFVGFDC